MLENFRVSSKMKFLLLPALIIGLTSVAVLAAPPQIVNQSYSSPACFFPVERQINVIASDPENNQITFTLVSGPGTIDPATGIITYQATQAGTTSFVVSVSDLEGSSSATITDDVSLNTSPTVSGMEDTAYYMCTPQYVYVPVNISDPDNNIVDISYNYGYYDSTAHQLRFVPFESGMHEVILTVTDACGEKAADTAYIDIINDNQMIFEVPDDTTHFVCETGTYYFPIEFSGYPDGTTISVSGIHAWYDADSVAVAFSSECGITNNITVTVTTPCYTYVKTFTVIIVCNSAPLLALPNDFTTSSCLGGEICVPISVSDINNNLLSVTANIPGSVYKPKFKTVCFTADTLGMYTLVVTATDACGEISTDNVKINVVANTPPVLSYIPGTTYFRQCVFEEICVPVAVSDVDGNLADVTGNFGYYNFDTHEYCFLPDSSGNYSLQVTAVDECGDTDQITIDLVVEQGDYVNVNISDTLFNLCGPQAVCIPVSVTGVYENIFVNYGSFSNNEICFQADTAGIYTIELTADAECNSSSSTAYVEVRMEERIICPADVDTLLCEATTLAFDYETSILVDSVHVSSPAYLENGQVMVPILADDIYTITLTAFSVCGQESCSFNINAVINTAPDLVAPLDFSERICTYHEICLPPFSVFDAEDNIDSVKTSHGYIQGGNTVCFTPRSMGTYPIVITAYDGCGVVGADTVQVTVVQGDYAAVHCRDTVVDLCQPGPVSIPIEVLGVYNNIYLNYGTYSNGQVTFVADTAGIYSIQVTAQAECNTSSCISNVEVRIDPPIVCPADVDSIFLCSPDTLIYDFQTSGLVTKVEVSSPAFIVGNKVHVPILTAGLSEVTLTAYSVCGVDQCSFRINSYFNHAPTVSLGEDRVISTCNVETLKLNYIVADADNNLDSIVTSVNVDSLNEAEGWYYVTPSDFGSFTVVFTAYDACNAVKADTVSINYIQSGYANIECLTGPVYDTICGPDTIYIDNIIIEPQDALVTVWPNGKYDYVQRRLAIYISQEGLYPIKIKAQAECAVDSCEFDLNVHIPIVPVITCPAEIDTLVCVNRLDKICVPVSITGTDVQITVNNGGSYENDSLCFAVDTAGLYKFEITGTNYCGSDSCQVIVNVTDDEAPQLFLPADTVIIRCPQDTTQICIDGFYSTDSRSQSFLSKDCGLGELDLIGFDTARLCFWPDTFGVYEFCISTTDGCKTTSKSYFVTIQDKGDCDVCIKLSIRSDECSGVGIAHDVSIDAETNDYITGFDIMLEYDVSVMSFQSADTSGGIIGEWEYFTFRLGGQNCGNACPSGLIRFIGIADKETVTGHPSASSLNLEGELFKVTYRIANDQNLIGQYLPIHFYWFTCNDNTFTSLNYDSTYFENTVYDAEGRLIWDEEDNVLFPNSNRPTGLGAPDGCLYDADLASPRRCAQFINGGICILSSSVLSGRGDVNMNNIPYEIADAVLFSNYFIHGLSVFTVDIIRQVMATDINADGLTLTVSDLVQMIRIIIGDADPIQKLLPHNDELIITERDMNNIKTISTESVSNIGAALFKYDVVGDLNINEVQLAENASNMTMMHNVMDNQLVILVYDFETDKIESGLNDIVEIPFFGNGSLEFNSAEIVDYNGRPYNVAYKGSVLPQAYELKQNYPNPFNPSTNIEFALPRSTSWKLSIYNITGALVKQFDGDSEAGIVNVQWDGTNSSGTLVASGVYLYRLEAAEFKQSKKMLLLK